MRDVTAIDPMWLSELAPHFYEYRSNYQKTVVQQPASTVSKSMENSISSIFGAATAPEAKKDAGHFNLFAIPDEPKPRRPAIDFSRSYFDDEDEFPPKSKMSKFNR